jgi:hypothetical protein
VPALHLVPEEESIELVGCAGVRNDQVEGGVDAVDKMDVGGFLPQECECACGRLLDEVAPLQIGPVPQSLGEDADTATLGAQGPQLLRRQRRSRPNLQRVDVGDSRGDLGQILEDVGHGSKPVFSNAGIDAAL